MKPARLSAEADVELVETAGFYDERQVGLGAAFISEFVKATQLIQQFPSSGRPIGNRMRRVLTNRFPYAIIYLEYREEFLVVAIAHTSRRPGYWKNRTTPDPRSANHDPRTTNNSSQYPPEGYEQRFTNNEPFFTIPP